VITSFFYNSSIRRITVLFGTLFNDINIRKSDGSTVKVPLSWSSKSKWFIKIKDREDSKKLQSITYPRMGFIMTNVAHDLTRKTSTLNSFASRNINNDKELYRINFPSPVKIDYSLFIASKTIDEGLQIVEQIIPYFDPTFSVTINELDDINVLRDIPVTLNSVAFSDEFEGQYDGNEVMIWDLSFSVEANLYKNIASQGVIKRIVVDAHIKSAADLESVKDRLIIQVDPFTAEVTDEYALLESWNLVLDDEPTVPVPTVDIVTITPEIIGVDTPILFTVDMDIITSSVVIEFNNVSTSREAMVSSTNALQFTVTHPGFEEAGVNTFKLFVNNMSTAAYSGSFTVLAGD
jgi:T4-like virus Myoviridae tail sheath stabiliser